MDNQQVTNGLWPLDGNIMNNIMNIPTEHLQFLVDRHQRMIDEHVVMDKRVFAGIITIYSELEKRKEFRFNTRMLILLRKQKRKWAVSIIETAVIDWMSRPPIKSNPKGGFIYDKSRSDWEQLRLIT